MIDAVCPCYRDNQLACPIHGPMSGHDWRPAARPSDPDVCARCGADADRAYEKACEERDYSGSDNPAAYAPNAPLGGIEG